MRSWRKILDVAANLAIGTAVVGMALRLVQYPGQALALGIGFWLLARAVDQLRAWRLRRVAKRNLDQRHSLGARIARQHMGRCSPDCTAPLSRRCTGCVR